MRYMYALCIYCMMLNLFFVFTAKMHFYLFPEGPFLPEQPLHRRTVRTDFNC